MAYKHMKVLDWASITFLLISGFAWLIFGIARMFFGHAFLLVDSVFGVTIANIIYLLVGVSVIYSIVALYRLGKK